MAAGELIHGLHAVRAALQADPASVVEVWIDRSRRDPRIQAILKLAVQNHVPVQRLTRRALDDSLPGARHQGVAARFHGTCMPDEADLERLLDTLAAPPFLLVLDGVQDPHNLGACLRSAGAAGVHAVIAPRDRAAGLTPVARKVACGAAEHIPFVQVTNLARCLRGLRARGVWLIGAAGEAEQDVYQTDLTGPLAVVMGAEEKGLRRLTREACDALVSIPMQGCVESLNVSVATGILLFEALRQRRSA